MNNFDEKTIFCEFQSGHFQLEEQYPVKTNSLFIDAHHVFIFWQKGEPSPLAPASITPPKNRGPRVDVPFSFGAGPLLP